MLKKCFEVTVIINSTKKELSFKIATDSVASAVSAVKRDMREFNHMTTYEYSILSVNEIEGI